jgi:hypothetical protein
LVAGLVAGLVALIGFVVQLQPGSHILAMDT